DAFAHRRGAPAALRGDARDADPMDRSPPRPDRRRLPGKGDRVPRRDGRAWPLQAAVSRVPLAGAAHRVCRERVQLLRDLPDRRPAPRRPLAVAPAERRLAAIDRRSLMLTGLGAWALGASRSVNRDTE